MVMYFDTCKYHKDTFLYFVLAIKANANEMYMQGK